MRTQKCRRLGTWLVVLMMIGLLTGCRAQPVPTPSVQPAPPLLVFSRLGGIAGFQDRLVIGERGQYYLVQSGRELLGSLSTDRQAQLDRWRAQFAPFTLRFEDNPNGPDNMVREVSWTGTGPRVPGAAEQEEIFAWAAQCLAEFSAQGR